MKYAGFQLTLSPQVFTLLDLRCVLRSGVDALKESPSTSAFGPSLGHRRLRLCLCVRVLRVVVASCESRKFSRFTPPITIVRLRQMRRLRAKKNVPRSGGVVRVDI